MIVRILFLILATFFTIGSTLATGAPLERNGEKEFEGAKGTIKVRVNETEISIADSLSLSVEVLTPKGFVAKLPSFQDFGFSTDFNERSQRFRATDISAIEPVPQEDGSTLFRQQFTLEPWLSGDYSIMPLMVSYFKDDSTTAEGKDEEDQESSSAWRIPAFHVMSDGIRVKVTGLGEERRELSDLFGQADYTLERLTRKERRKEDKSDQELAREEEEMQEAAKSLADREFPWWILWLMLACAVIAPLIWYLGRRKIIDLFTKPRRPAHEIAYQAIEELKAKELLKNNKIKEFYYELSFIMRQYIGNRFHIFAVNQTTEEFFQHLLLSNPFDHKSEEILARFSEHADLVKYSRHRPDQRRSMESLTIAQSFIDKTKEQADKEQKEVQN